MRLFRKQLPPDPLRVYPAFPYRLPDDSWGTISEINVAESRLRQRDIVRLKVQPLSGTAWLQDGIVVHINHARNQVICADIGPGVNYYRTTYEGEDKDLDYWIECPDSTDRTPCDQHGRTPCDGPGSRGRLVGRAPGNHRGADPYSSAGRILTVLAAEPDERAPNMAYSLAACIEDDGHSALLLRHATDRMAEFVTAIAADPDGPGGWPPLNRSYPYAYVGLAVYRHEYQGHLYGRAVNRWISEMPV